MIQFKCEQCGQKIRTSDKFAVKKAKCPKCKSSLIVPKEESLTTQESKLSSTKPVSNEKGHQGLANMSDAEISAKLPHSETGGGTKPAMGEKKRSFLVPHYDETSLFVMSITFVLLYLVNKTMRTDLHKLVSHDSDIRLIIVAICFVAGILFSIFHAFSRREKKFGEKTAMLLFAVLVSAGTGIYAGIHMLKNSGGWLIIFPIWNIINGVLLLIMLRVGSINVDCISDRNATFAQVVMGLFSTVVILVCCQYFFKLHWAITYSICICYTVSLDKAVRGVFGCR